MLTLKIGSCYVSHSQYHKYRVVQTSEPLQLVEGGYQFCDMIDLVF